MSIAKGVALLIIAGFFFLWWYRKRKNIRHTGRLITFRLTGEAKERFEAQLEELNCSPIAFFKNALPTVELIYSSLANGDTFYIKGQDGKMIPAGFTLPEERDGLRNNNGLSNRTHLTLVWSQEEIDIDS